VHLDDQQLIELDESSLIHITSCAVCRQRLAVLKQLRANLQEVAIPEPIISLDDGWQAVKLAQQTHQKNVSYNQNNNNEQHWWNNPLPLAASILLLAFILGDKYFIAPDIEDDIQLTALIEQNDILQKQLAAMQEGKNKNMNGGGQLRYQLTAIDQKIQRAYIETTSAEQKLLLWLERQKTIERWIEKQNAPQSIKI
jgi:hypothetical protein